MCPQGSGAPQVREQFAFRTTCGRDVRVGRLALGGPDRPARRVSLSIGHSPGADDDTWAALTPAEARQLAAALLRQAAAADRGTADGAASQVGVSYVGGESYAVATRGHALLTDQPVAAGGADTAMTPIELLVASLSSCVAFYTGRYLARHGLNRDGLHVTAECPRKAKDMSGRTVFTSRVMMSDAHSGCFAGSEDFTEAALIRPRSRSRA